MSGRRHWHSQAVLMAGALAIGASAAHAGRPDPAPAAQDDKAAEKQKKQDEKAAEKQKHEQEKAQAKADKAHDKDEKAKRKAEERERKQREKEQRKAEKERRKHGEPTPAPTPTPTATPAPKPPAAPVFTATPGLDPRERLSRTVDLLQAGNEGQARAELTQLLADQPTSREGRALLETIETDPQALFGADSFAYKVGPRDTLVTLAIAFFGDSYKFYGLARYNHIAVPSSVKPGDVIQIPGRQRAPIVRRPPREEEHGPAPVATPTPEPVQQSTAPRADPARAQRLRRAGLEQMSAGSIDRAVALLEAATRADPGNTAIGADLARARRIQATVHGR